MPNLCNNDILIAGQFENIKKLLDELVIDDKMDITLADPMPEELKDITIYTYNAVEGIIKEPKIDIESIKKAVKNGVELPKKSIQKLYDKYGHPSWYSWSMEHWSVTWAPDPAEFSVSNWDEVTANNIFMAYNIFEHPVSIPEPDRFILLSFDTAWNPPINLLKTISKKFVCEIIDLYSEPNTDLRGGVHIYNGKELAYMEVGTTEHFSELIDY